MSKLKSILPFSDVLGTFDYVNEANGYLVFRTSPLEKSRLVFQMGTADADRAVKLAKMVENDVSAIDVNMGCPQPYSTRFGMGAALMSKPENAKAILKNLVENVKLPITCKIRYAIQCKTMIGSRFVLFTFSVFSPECSTVWKKR